ncbi:hypothetical protein [Candidatus Marithrix sp. Canyon 246]|uniref:hypothetical protein n=1 Tax=Candidatus Marithrix sp. Canyon 246 TaxID=1827136 RepID=UPI00084A1924|nr:hypothetical protein [Candidatus Marithrix sp. Canyon 246]
MQSFCVFLYKGVITTSPFTLTDNLVVIGWGNSQTQGWDFSDAKVEAITNIAIDKNITGNEFYYYWNAYGGWSTNGLTLK